MGQFLVFLLAGVAAYVGFCLAGNVHRVIKEKKKKKETSANENV